jgi:hypothetical protein
MKKIKGLSKIIFSLGLKKEAEDISSLDDSSVQPWLSEWRDVMRHYGFQNFGRDKKWHKGKSHLEEPLDRTSAKHDIHMIEQAHTPASKGRRISNKSLDKFMREFYGENIWIAPREGWRSKMNKSASKDHSNPHNRFTHYSKQTTLPLNWLLEIFGEDRLKEVYDFELRKSGDWRPIKGGYVKVNGEWHLFYPTTGSVTYGVGSHSFTVPPGIFTLTVNAAGGSGGGGGADTQGGSAGQAAQSVSGTIKVRPGDVITVSVGGGGAGGATDVSSGGGGAGGSSTAGYAGGRGGNAGPGGWSGGGGGGGGATIFKNAANKILAIAAGGGGGGGGGNYGPGRAAQGSPGTGSGNAGGAGVDWGEDGGGGGGGGGGYGAGTGGSSMGEDGGIGGNSGSSFVTSTLTIGAYGQGGGGAGARYGYGGGGYEPGGGGGSGTAGYAIISW